MGGGKTVVTLTALEALDAVEPVYPVLVLGPLRVIRSTWPAEVKKWAHLRHLRVSVITGSAAEREAALRRPADIYCMNYDNLVWLTEKCVPWKFRTVVADEHTRLKSFRLRQGGARAAALGKVAHAPGSRFYGLTGTPSPNGIKDLWGQAWFLDRGARLGRSHSAFTMRWFRTADNGFGLEPLSHAQGEIEGLLADICLTVKGLPVDDPIVSPVYVELDGKARALYNQMEDELFVWLETHGVEAANSAVKVNKLLQIASGFIFDEGGVWHELHRAKVDALESIVEEANGAPVLVSHNFVPDKERLMKHFRHARFLDANPQTIVDWNAGRIQMLIAHPACLHPATEVLTEHRGWVRVTDVLNTERVFDGVEFVKHGGCSFSGIRPVITTLGLTLTPRHKLLIGAHWVEAADVRDSEDARRAARYTYEGDDPRLGALLRVRGGEGDGPAERPQGEPRAAEVPVVCRDGLPPHDGHALLGDLEGRGQSRNEPGGQGLRALWGRRPRCHTGVALLQELLSRYVHRLPGRSHHRPAGQQPGVLQGELPVGDERRAAIEQEQQSRRPLSGTGHAPRGVLPSGGSEPGRDLPPPEQRDVGGGGPRGLCGVDIQEGPQISPVYDLVDCGPRNRFLIRNADGDVFVSHNSAGHGLNLQDGGNILARFGFDWNLENYMQIIERIGPMRQMQAGHPRPVYDYPIVAKGTFDGVVLDRLEGKLSVQAALLKALERRSTA